MATLNLMGDVMFGELLENLHRGLRSRLEATDLDPFARVAHVLAAGDLNLCNLECVLSDVSAHADPFSRILVAPESSLALLTRHGMGAVNTANNHALDHGEAAFARSCDLLRGAGIAVVGYTPGVWFQREPVVREVGGRTLALLGYNISNFPAAERQALVARIAGVVAEARGGADLVLVSIHWGEEYTNLPPPEVVRFGRTLLDAGCDILHGHHSHRIQGVLTDRGRVFAPSLGNFVFDQLVPGNRTTGILQVQLGDGGPGARVLPCRMNDDYQPDPELARAGYQEDLDASVAACWPPGEEERFADEVARMVAAGHRRNRLRMRMRMLAHFWDYLPHLGRVLAYRRSPTPLFSVITDEASLPGER